MTLTQLYDAVRIRMGVPVLDGLLTGTALIDLINEGLQMVSTEHDWPWLQGTETFLTESGVSAYDPAVAVGHIWTKTLALTPLNGDTLVLRTLIEVREQSGLTSYVSNLTPDMYCIQDDQILLAPTPQTAFTMIHDYYGMEPELADVQDTPMMPRQWHYIIVHAAAMLGHLRQNEGERAELERKQYDSWLRRMHDDVRRSKGSRRIRVRPGSML